MASLSTPYISNALSRLRGGISLCCGIVAIALIVQLLIWGVASFMDVRFTVLEEQITPSTVVSAADAARDKPIGSADARPLESPSEAKTGADVEPVNLNRVATKYDRMMNRASALALSAGTIAMLLMIPMIVVGVMLGAGSATPGIDKVVSAFMWSLVVSMMTLPVGQLVGLPWQYGGLVPYEHMTAHVDREMIEGSWGSLIFHARFMLLPLTCLVGVGIIGLRFSNGVYSGIIPKEDMRLDPTLEREAANMKASSLLGGRNAVALRAVAPTAAPIAPATPMGAAVQPAPSLTAVTASGAGEVKPGMLQATAGEAPKRLI
jgi:hypothetical protein